MPRFGYTKRTYTGPRPWEMTDAAPFSDVPEQTRGELRLAAEVALGEMTGQHVPSFAHERAVECLQAVARG